MFEDLKNKLCFLLPLHSNSERFLELISCMLLFLSLLAPHWEPSSDGFASDRNHSPEVTLASCFPSSDQVTMHHVLVRFSLLDY